MNSGPDMARTARVLHLALLMGCVIVAAAFTALRSVGAFGMGTLPTVLQWAAAPGVLVLVGLRLVLGRRLGTGGPEVWTARLPAALAIWAVEEGWFLLGTMLWGLTGGPAPLLLAGIAFGMLLWDRPGRLEGSQ